MPEQTLSIRGSILDHIIDPPSEILSVYWTDSDAFEFVDDDVSFYQQESQPDIFDSIHGISGSHPDLTINQQFSILNTGHGFVKSNVAVVTDNLLSIVDSKISQTGEHPELTTGIEETLSVTNSRNSLSGTHPTLTTVGEQTLSVVSSKHNLVGEVGDLSAVEVRWIDDDGVEFIDTPTDFVPHEVWLNPVDSVHGQIAETTNVILGSEKSLEIHGAVHALFANEQTVTADSRINASDVSHVLASGRPAIVASANLVLSPVSSSHSLSGIGHVNIGSYISSDNAIHQHIAEIPEAQTLKTIGSISSSLGHVSNIASINLEIKCLIANTVHGHRSEEAFLSKNTERVLNPHDAVHKKTVEVFKVSKWTSLGVIDSQTGHRTDSVFIRYNGQINGVDSILSVESEKIIVTLRCLLTVTDSIHGVESIPFELLLYGSLVVTDSIIGIKTDSISLNINNKITAVETSHDINSTVSINSDNRLITVDSTLAQEVSSIVFGTLIDVTNPIHGLNSSNVNIAFVIYPFKTFVANDEEYFYLGRSTAYSFRAKDMLKRAA